MGRKIAVLVFTCLLALVGQVVAAELVGDLFSGMEWGQAALMGALLYLTVVVLVCTWLILRKLDQNK